MYTLSDLTSKVVNSISEYIEFDVNEIFNCSDFITIYGGAVRNRFRYSSILNYHIFKYNFEYINITPTTKIIIMFNHLHNP